MAKVVTVVKTDGKVRCDTNLDYLFSTLRNGTYTLTIKRAAEKRTISQNDLMWMWFACIEKETGTPKQDVHDYYCRQFLRKQIVWNGETVVVIGQTSKLSTQQMSEFMTKIQADASAELGIQLPVPDDKFFEDFYQQYNF